MSEPFALKGRRIWVAGHRGMVGAAIVRRLRREGVEALTIERERLDLTRQSAVEDWLLETRPDAVVLAAAKVGGILANDSSPVDFLEQNLAMACNVISAAHRADVNRLLFLGSSCIYPRQAPQPLREDALLSAPLEPTNQWYAVAKIAGVKLAQAYRRQFGRDYISALPTNLYGPGDNFDPDTSHVIPALIRKAHLAKMTGASEMMIWGSGEPRREFLHVDDCADALVRLLAGYSGEAPVNVGSGEDLPIQALAELVARIVGFGGRIVNDLAKPDGAPRKLLSIDKLRAMGWRPSISLEAGIASTYAWFRAHEAENAAWPRS
jgi:GDP-L-fucose synthase